VYYAHAAPLMARLQAALRTFARCRATVYCPLMLVKLRNSLCSGYILRGRRFGRVAWVKLLRLAHHAPEVKRQSTWAVAIRPRVTFFNPQH
jgi:hypothetical protein